MSEIDILFEFENKYPFLYDEQVNGVAVYTCLRDGVFMILRGEGSSSEINSNGRAKIYARRILASYLKWNRYKKTKTLIFTSAVYRRDNGRNLAAEFLLEKYPNGIIFEWPSNKPAFDEAYFKDNKNYVPIEKYLIKYKLYRLFHKKELYKIENECRERIKAKFLQLSPTSENERKAVEYIVDRLPSTVVETELAQRVFKKLLKRYKSVEYAVDFWGSARENIIPVLQNSPKSIELQHGIITLVHGGYVYPSFVKNCGSNLFDRTVLVYSRKDKDILCNKSIFLDKQVEIIGNPRIKRYKRLFDKSAQTKKWILFTSQSYEQDGAGLGYYEKMIPLLKKFNEILQRDGKYSLAIKLHPRESENVISRYKKEVEGVKIFDSTSQLYQLLNESYLHLTATSTVLLEALEFDVPTVTLQYNVAPNSIYGFDTLHVSNVEEVESVWKKMLDRQSYEEYLEKLKANL